MAAERRSLHSAATLCGLAALALLIAGCGSLPHYAPPQADGAPGYQVDLSAIPDAVPRVEARSKYGNPDSYAVAGRRYQVLADSRGYVERGIASWYGTKFHGRRAAIGEPYDMFAMTAAHKTLPLPTYLEVTNLQNGRKVIVKVNDRGPFKANRIIDLSYAAAVKLGITGTGLVEIRAIDPQAWQRERRARQRTAAAKHSPRPQQATPGTPAAPRATAQAAPVLAALYFQIGAFAELRNPELLRKRLKALAPGKIRIVHNDSATQPLYRVHIGPIPSIEDADLMTRTLATMGLGEPHIVIY
ncbi:MAG: septal ring lytic transglycosylase RlpA family protein [Gammaproteobacteria bacterium]